MENVSIVLEVLMSVTAFVLAATVVLAYIVIWELDKDKYNDPI